MARTTRLVAIGLRRTKSALPMQHAAEILRPRPIDVAVENHVADIEGARFLRPGRRAHERIDLAV